MKTFGIRINIIVIHFLFLTIPNLVAQCPPPICNKAECGQVEIALAADANNVFCQGKTVKLQIDPSKTSSMDSFIVYWCDGDITRTSGSTLEFPHTYNIPEDEICKQSSTDYFVYIIGKKECGNGMSCRTLAVSLTLKHEPRAKFDYKNSVCINNKVDFINQSCNVDETLSDAYLWTFHDGTTSTAKNASKTYTSPGTYTVRLKVKNECGENEITQIITVVDYPDALVNISATAQDSVVCVGDVVRLINQSNQWSNIKWKFPVNNINRDTSNWKISHYLRKRDSLALGLVDSIPFIDTLVIETLRAGEYIFEMTSSNACGTVQWKFRLKVVESPDVTLTQPTPFCETASYDPNFSIEEFSQQSYIWTFPGGNPAASTLKDPGIIQYNAPGTYIVTLRVVAACDTITRTVQVVVNSREPVTITDPNKIFCQSSSPDTLLADRTGGTWSGEGITNTSLGIFDPSILSPGSYPITYTVGPVNCQSIANITLEVVASENVIVSDAVFCENTPITQLVASPSSGTWSGDPAVTASGLFDPILSGIGDFPIDYVYQDANGCSIKKTINVRVEAFPTLTTADTSIVCVGSGTVSLEDLLITNANPSGGTFSFLLNNDSVPDMINLQNYNVSVLPVTIVYNRNLCEVIDSAFIQFIEKPLLTITTDTTLCIFDTLFALSASVNGGTWSGLGVNSSTGIINLNSAGEGTKIYTYTFQPNTSCEQTETVNIDIKNPGVNLNAGPDQETCEGTSSFTLSGNSPTNGLWSGVAVDPMTGNIDVTQLTLDSLYLYTYCLTDVSVQGCQACSTKTFIVHSLPVPLFDIDGLTCINEDITIINQTLGNNTILFSLGDGTTSSADSIIHQYTNKGTYTITLQVTNQFMCSASTSQEIYVTTRPISAFTLLDEEGCAPFELMISNQSSGDDISYEWDINNKVYTEALPPFVILDGITKDSIFIISLAVTNQCGTVFYEDSVLAHPYPIVDFGVSEQSGCSPLTIDFANTSLGNPTTFFWNMGNGNIYSDSIPPAQTYTTLPEQITTYSILFVGTNMCGTDSLTKEVTIYPPDITAFIESPGLSLCQYDTLVLTAFSTPGAINTWKLIAPDGTLSGASGDLALFDMSQAGTYTAILYASRCGSDTDTVVVTVLPAPFVDFDLPSFACVGSQVNFTNLGIGIGGVTWDYGDGNNDAFGIHIYDTAGVFTVSLTAFSLVNNCPFSVTKTIRIIGLPTASFTPSVLSGCEPLEISFANNSTPGSNFDWNFGDMTSNSNDQNPMHTFLQDGIFQVKLTVYDSFGCFSDTSVLNIIVHPKPESRFSFPMQKYCHRYDSIPFTNLSTGSVGQEWIFENNSYLTQNITWLPSDSGAFSVTLVAMSTFGCIDSSYSVIDILPSPTSYFIVDNESGCEDLMVNFSNLSTAATQYIWDLKNGTSSVEKDLVYTFVNPGTYEVSLVSLTDNGCPSDTSTRTIIVHPKPMADFDIQKDSVCGVPMFVNFVNNSIGNIDNVWSINGITTSQDPSFDNVFTTASTNDISLIVQNEFLCADTIHKTVDIFLQPIAFFDVNGQACEGESIIIENNSMNAISYIWDIQNQGTITVVEPELVFETSGTYSIKLIAVYNEFCKDTFSLTSPIQIYDSPTADFEYEGEYDDNILGEVRFSNLSIDYDRSLWDFGDGNFSDEESPIHEYDINRNLLVTLTVFNDNGGKYTCIDSITKPVAPEWITTFFAPNALSPEYGDGDVKVFKPVGVGLAAFKISVYSPWGQAVWTSDKLENTSPSEVWDGTYDNAIVPQGAYSWIADVTFVNGIRKVFKGSVTVLR